MNPDSSEEKALRIYQVLHQVPFGKVVTYGQVAELAGMPRGARFVAYTLKHLPTSSKLPWHRVLKSNGWLAEAIASKQQKKLIDEGVRVNNRRVALKEFQWQP